MADTISPDEQAQVDTANASGTTPVVFIHGLWLLASSWDQWRPVFEAAGYSTVAPAWPDDPKTVAEAKAHPEVFAGKGVGQIADHLSEVIGALTKTPAVLGHSFGGLFAQIVAGRGQSAASVAIDPAPFRGVLPLPLPLSALSALKVASVALRNPLNRGRAVSLTYDQFRYGFANAVGDEEARTLYETYSVPGPGKPLFQAAAANLNPGSETKVDTKNPDRGPMLVISGEKDHTVPHAIASAEFKQQRKNSGVTEFHEFPGRGHSLTIDRGWREVADASLAFIQRFAKP